MAISAVDRICTGRAPTILCQIPDRMDAPAGVEVAFRTVYRIVMQFKVLYRCIGTRYSMAVKAV